MRIVAALLVLMLAALLPAHAEISRSDAADTAQRTSGGRVLTIERVKVDGRDVWRIKVVTPKGEVQVLRIDVTSGQIV
ncbi:MAG: PepSY domain-containing protein [Burkholderiales bacterium]|nr:PepSY domain-containing protein [Burkholderiales bacterium]